MNRKRQETHKTTKKGYLRFRKSGGKLRMEHCIVWEEHCGKIPEGMQIHHKDFDKTNNDIENLQLVSPVEHRRLHEGCIMKDGVWHKPCKICGEFKPCDSDNWYFSRGWIMGKVCKPCYIKKVCDERKERVRKGWKRNSGWPNKDEGVRRNETKNRTV